MNTTQLELFDVSEYVVKPSMNTAERIIQLVLKHHIKLIVDDVVKLLREEEIKQQNQSRDAA